MDNSSASKYLGVRVLAAKDDSYINSYGKASHSRIRLGYTANGNSWGSSLSGLKFKSVASGLAIPAGTFYVYIYPM
jgi:hypothetical protein